MENNNNIALQTSSKLLLMLIQFVKELVIVTWFFVKSEKFWSINIKKWSLIQRELKYTKSQNWNVNIYLYTSKPNLPISLCSFNTYGILVNAWKRRRSVKKYYVRVWQLRMCGKRESSEKQHHLQPPYASTTSSFLEAQIVLSTPFSLLFLIILMTPCSSYY